MAKIEFNDAKCGIKPASTWGTAADLTSGAGLLHFESINFDETPGIKRALNASNRGTGIIRLEEAVTLNFEAELQYHSLINQLIAGIMGTAGSPTEQNVGEGDYLHTIDLAASTLGTFFTVAFNIESDVNMEFPSAKPASLSISGGANGVPRVSGSMICDQMIFSTAATPTNTASEVAALSLPTVEYAVCNGSTLYYRQNAASGGALSGSDDKKITNWVWSINRGLERGYVYQGANTKFTEEPVQLAEVETTFEVNYLDIDDSDHDPMADYKNETALKAEMFFDGNQIASGDNASYKFQIPLMQARKPNGYGPARGQRLQGGAIYECMTGSAPTGMTGVTDMRIELTNTRSTDLLA